MTIIDARLTELANLTLKSGDHRSVEDGMCVMEAAAYIAGEPHSDQPDCVCPVIAAFCRTWNDSITDDETRTRLLGPIVPLTIGTRSTPDMELIRSRMSLDWLVRTFSPTWLRNAGLTADAVALAALPELTTTAPAALPMIYKVGAAAQAAALTAALGAARRAALAAAGDKAWDAVWDAAGNAAWWAGAWAAAGAAAGAALADTVVELQASAQDLLRRMCEVGR